MKSITIEKYTTNNKNCSDLIKKDVINKLDNFKTYLDTIFIYIYSLESENDGLKQDKARLYAENATLRKQLDLKERKEKPNELDDIFKKLKELRSQKIKFEEELEKCMTFVQNQYDDLK